MSHWWYFNICLNLISFNKTMSQISTSRGWREAEVKRVSCCSAHLDLQLALQWHPSIRTRPCFNISQEASSTGSVPHRVCKFYCLSRTPPDATLSSVQGKVTTTTAQPRSPSVPTHLPGCTLEESDLRLSAEHSSGVRPPVLPISGAPL